MKKNRIAATDPDSIGNILVRMRAITREELYTVIRAQAEMTRDRLLGELLLLRGFVSEAQLRVALDAQAGLRSGSKHVRAMAAARLAEVSADNVIQLAAVTREESRETRRLETGAEHPALSAEMLARGVEK